MLQDCSQRLATDIYAIYRRAYRSPSGTPSKQRYGGQLINAGTIIVRQRGSKFVAGLHVGTGRDWTLFAMATGHVKFDRAGRRVNIVPTAAPASN